MNLRMKRNYLLIEYIGIVRVVETTLEVVIANGILVAILNICYFLFCCFVLIGSYYLVLLLFAVCLQAALVFDISSFVLLLFICVGLVCGQLFCFVLFFPCFSYYFFFRDVVLLLYCTQSVIWALYYDAKGMKKYF